MRLTPVAGDRSAPEPDDSALLRCIGLRDRVAFARLYDRHAELVYSVALRVLADPPLAQDITQEVFLRLWRRPGAFDPERGRFISWLASVTRNRAVDELRVRGRRRMRELDESACVDDPPDPNVADPQAAAEVAAERERVRAALATLPPEQRQALELAYFAGLSQSEIAERLGQPLGTVKTRTRLALLKLRLCLGADREQERSGLP